MILYEIVVTLLALPLLPLLLLRLPVAEVRARLGAGLPRLTRSVWIHAASVGEVNAVRPLVEKILTAFPELPVVLTTTSVTGRETASGISGRIHAHLLPFDIPFLQRLALRRFHPRLAIVVETEIWPGMLGTLHHRGVPVILVNARISEKSLRRYRLLSPIFRPLLSAIKTVFAQSRTDADRFRELGVRNVVNAGNLKFAVRLPGVDVPAQRKAWGFGPEDFIVTLGSSRPGEERLLARVFHNLRGDIPNLRMIIAPRHLKRLDQALADLPPDEVRLLSDIGQSGRILVIDRMHVLTIAYAISDLALVGGSFVDYKGHNPLEPACYGIPVIMGPYHSACRDSVRILQENQAIRIMKADELDRQIRLLHHDEDTRRKMGEQARQTMKKGAQSLETIFAGIRNHLTPTLKQEGTQ